MKKLTLTIATAGAAVIAGSSLLAAPAHATALAGNPACYATSGGGLKCGNSAPTTLRTYPNFDSPQNNPRTDTLRSNPSYFNCYVRGSQHSGGNNVWYRAQGDDHGRYGYIAASHVYTPRDPFSGVRKC